MRVVIMSGVPGSGKSYRSGEFGGVVVSADNYFMVGGEYRFNPRKLPEAHAKCLRDFLAALCAKEDTIVVDNTNLTAWQAAPYVALAGAYGYEVEILRVHCDPAVAFERQQHGVPKHAHDRMVEAFNNPDFPPFWNVRNFHPK